MKLSFSNLLKRLPNHRQVEILQAKDDLEETLDIAEIVRTVKYVKILQRVLLHKELSSLLPYMQPFVIGSLGIKNQDIDID